MIKLSDTAKEKLKVKFKELINTTFDNAVYTPVSDLKAKDFFNIIEIDIGRPLTENERIKIFSIYPEAIINIITASSIGSCEINFNLYFEYFDKVVNNG